jgi:hypothetical protein
MLKWGDKYNSDNLFSECAWLPAYEFRSKRIPNKTKKALIDHGVRA